MTKAYLLKARSRALATFIVWGFAIAAVLNAQPLRGCFDPAAEMPGNGVTYSAPAAAPLGSSIFVFIRGVDGTILVQRQGSGIWNRLAGAVAADDPAAVAMNNGIHVFIRGSDSRLYRNTCGPGPGFLHTYVWSGWIEVPGSMYTLSGPAATFKDGRLYLFVRGIFDSLLWTSFDGASWTEWAGLPLIRTYAAPAVSAMFGGIYVFATDISNQIIYTYTYGTGTKWYIWQSVPGLPTTRVAPGVASAYADTVNPDLFVPNLYNDLQDATMYPASIFGPLVASAGAIGSRTQSRVAVVYDASSRLNLFFRGDDYRVYTRIQCVLR